MKKILDPSLTNMVLTNVAGGVSVSVKKKITKGRKKIEIKKIEETNSRQVTFSKRRTGLFKKASELCVLTGAQVAILVNSPGGRVFAFGHPNVDLLLDRYLSSSTSVVDGGATAAEHYSPPPLPTMEFNRHYVEVSRELETEKKRREMIPASGGGMWWFNNDVEGMEVEEMDQFLWSLVELKKKVLTKADELMMINKAPAMLGGPNVCEMGGWTGFNDTVGVSANSGVHGGFIFQQGGESEGFN